MTFKLVAVEDSGIYRYEIMTDVIALLPDVLFDAAFPRDGYFGEYLKTSLPEYSFEDLPLAIWSQIKYILNNVTATISWQAVDDLAFNIANNGVSLHNQGDLPASDTSRESFIAGYSLDCFDRNCVNNTIINKFKSKTKAYDRGIIESAWFNYESNKRARLNIVRKPRFRQCIITADIGCERVRDG